MKSLRSLLIVKRRIHWAWNWNPLTICILSSWETGDQALWGNNERTGHAQPWGKKIQRRYDSILQTYLKDSHSEKGRDQFSIIPECRTCNNEVKLQEYRFQLKGKTSELLEQYNDVLCEVVSTPLLEAFKTKLDNDLPDMFWFGFLHWRGSWTRAL